MKILSTNELVAREVDRQSIVFQQLLAAGVVPRLQILRDEQGAALSNIRSYSAAAVRHVGFFATSKLCSSFISVKTVPANKLLEAVKKANDDDRIHGILTMSPTVHDFEEIAQTIHPEKDVDRMGAGARLLKGRESLLPATPRAVVNTLRAHGLWSVNERMTIQGRGRTVGAHVLGQALELHNTEYSELSPKDDPHARVRLINQHNEDLLPAAIAASSVAILTAGVDEKLRPEMLHDDLVVVGVGRNDFVKTVYDSDKRVALTPQHNDPVHMGIGALTSAYAWGNTLENAGLLIPTGITGLPVTQ